MVSVSGRVVPGVDEDDDVAGREDKGREKAEVKRRG